MNRTQPIVVAALVLLVGCGAPQERLRQPDRDFDTAERTAAENEPDQGQAPDVEQEPDGKAAGSEETATISKTVDYEEQARVESVSQEKRAATAVVAAREQDTLEAWEQFAVRFPDTSFRAEAGKRIEELAPQGHVVGIRKRLAEFMEEHAGEGITPVFIVGVVVTPELESPDSGAALLFKDSDYSYRSVSDRRIVPSPLAQHQPLLRYLGPREAMILHLTEAALLNPRPRACDQAVTNAWEEWVRELGIEFESTRLSVMLPPDEMVPDATAPGGRSLPDWGSQRFYLSGIFDGDALIKFLPKLSKDRRAWVAERLDAVRWAPGNAELELTRAICLGRWEELAGRESEAAPIATRIFRAGHPDARLRGAQALARIDPSGEELHRLGVLDDQDLAIALYQAIQDDESIAIGFQSLDAGIVATAARQASRTELRGDWEVARAAADRIRGAGLHDVHPNDHVRILLLQGDFEAIADLGDGALEPLLRVLGEDPSNRKDAIRKALDAYATEHGPSEMANALIRNEGIVRTGLRQLPLQYDIPAAGLFDAGALQYLKMPREVENLVALVGQDPSWQPALEEWQADAVGRPLTEYLAEGKVALEATGGGIDTVHVAFACRADHRLRIVDPPGLQFAPADGAVQNMVTRETLDFWMEPGESGKFSAEVSCANRSRKVPDYGDEFSVVRVESPRLTAVLTAIEEEELSMGAAQAAVWIFTDNSTMKELGQLHRRMGTRYLGGLISKTDMVKGMHAVASAGVDLHERAIWDSARTLLEFAPKGKLEAWLKAELARQD